MSDDYEGTPRYQRYTKDMNDRAREAGQDSDRWFPRTQASGQLSLAIHALGVNGEAGEVAECIKKFLRGSIDQDTLLQRVQMEIVDVMVYCYNLAWILGLDLETLYDAKRKFNDERFTKEQQRRQEVEDATDA
jgi:NTP pyrophosphatase (non-canonical NTP hydrolase)